MVKRLITVGRAHHVAIAVLALSACDARSPGARLSRDVKEVRSWAAESCLVADRWRQRSVPTHYALDTLQLAVRELTEKVRVIERQYVGEPGGPEAAHATREVLRLCGRLEGDIEHGNGAAAIATCRDMSLLRDRLAKMAASETQRR